VIRRRGAEGGQQQPANDAHGDGDGHPHAQRARRDPEGPGQLREACGIAGGAGEAIGGKGEETPEHAAHHGQETIGGFIRDDGYGGAVRGRTELPTPLDPTAKPARLPVARLMSPTRPIRPSSTSRWLR
jgi:hypothetical protein